MNIQVRVEHSTVLEKTVLDQGRTDRISLTGDLGLNLQSPASYGHELLTCKSSRSTAVSYTHLTLPTNREV